MPAPIQIDIDPDIRRAETLPARFYRDPAVFEWARDALFARSWQLISGADGASVPQHVVPFRFLEGCIDEPLLLVRDGADELRCLSNVCTHRGAIVAPEPCRGNHLRCVYHGRRWNLDGSLHSMPEFDDVEGFPSARDDLRSFEIARWGPFVFTAIDPAFPADALIGPMRDRCRGLPLDRLVLDRSRSRDYLVQANWALYCDNYLEGFHIPYVHPSLADTLDYGRYRTELDAYSNVQIGIAEGGEHTLELPRDGRDANESVAGYYWWLFPNLMFNIYPWGISVNVVKPLAVDRTRVSYLTYVWDESKLDAGAGAGLDRVEREDEMVVELVQSGVSGRVYERGRYAPRREQGVHHFHRLIASFANGEHA